jgi:hypothetical protein
MSENKAIDKANLELALSENNKKLLEYTDNADAKLRQEFGPVSKYQKYLNTGLDYIQICFPGDTTVNNVDVGTIIPFNRLAFSNNLDFDSSTYTIKLNAGKTYKITSHIRTLNSSGYFYFNTYNKTQNKTVGLSGCVETPSSYNNNVVNTPIKTILSCNEDTEIQFKITAINAARTIIFTGLSTVIIEEINRQIVIDPVEHVNIEYGLEDTPIGHIISRMGAITPKHYLLCDGSEHNIADYPHLAQHIIDSFGSVNYYGGDGINTFKVPNLMYNIGDATEFAPNMTSESTPSPYKVTASSYLNDFYPYRAFDGNTSNFWHNHYSTTTEDWLMFDAGEKMKIVGFKIFARPGFSSQAPCRFKIQGSDDGESFEDIEVYNVTWAGSNGSQSFDCPLSNYRFYRFFFSYKSSDYGGNELSFSEVRFFLPKEIKVATFIKYEPTYYTNVYNPLVGRSETVLFEGNYSESNNSNTLTTGITLNDSIENYNELYVEAMYENSGSKIYGHLTTYIKIDSLIEHYGYPTIELFCTNGTSDCLVRINCGFIDDKTLSIGWINESVNWHSPYISKIIGVKYQEAQLENNTDEDINSAIAEAVAEINEEV